MKKYLILIFIMLVGLLFSETKLTVILFDTSKSMIGQGDGNGIDIFDDVKHLTFNSVLNDKLIGENLMILPFDERIDDNIFMQHITSESNVFQAKKYMKDLVADGQKTYLARSFGETINFLKNYTKENNLTNLQIKLVLITDGRGNGEEDKSEKKMSEFLDKYEIARSEFDYFFTKVWVIGENVFDKETLNLLNKKGIQTFVMNRDDLKNKKIFIQPANVNLETESGTFDLYIQSDEQLNGKTLELKSLYSHYNFSPESIVLDSNQNSYQITAEHIFQKPFIDQINLNIVDEDAKIFVGENFSEKPMINFTSVEDDKKIVILDKKYKVTNSGKIVLKLNRKIDAPFLAKVNIDNSNSKVEYKSKEELVIVKGDEVHIELIPKTSFHLFRNRLQRIRSKTYELKITLEAQNSDFFFDEKPAIVKNKITVNKFNYITPFVVLGIVFWRIL